MKLYAFVLFAALPGSVATAQLPDLIFSEYVEGSSNEKYLEIYNGTGSAVMLTGYSVELYANGAAAPTNTFSLTGGLANGQVLVLKNNLASGYTGTATSAAVCNYNGDDALVLKNGTTTIDVIGKVACDPGTAWLAGSFTTLDRTLIRKPDICAGYNGSLGSCTPVASASYPRLNTDWVLKSTNDLSNLGTHFSACGSACASHRFFRTRQSGAWYDVTTWESAASAAGPYTNACIYPTYNNTDSIVILASHTVSVVRAAVPADQVLVSAGGTLAMGDSADLDLNAGSTGVDLVVEGTFIDSTRSTGAFGITDLSPSATWQLGPAATFIKLRNSSSTFYRDNYEGGIATVPATANWNLRCIDATSLPSFTSANMYFPNLIIENSSGTLWDMSTGGLGSFSGTTTIIKGNLDIGGTGTTGVIMAQNGATATSTSNPLDVQGNLFIRAGSTFVNRKTGSPDLYGGGLNIKGDLLVDGTLQILNNMFDAVHSVLRLSGTADQTISGNSFISASGFDLNKPGPSLNVFTNNSILVSDSLYLNSGILQTNGSSVVGVQDTTIVSSPASMYTNLPANIGWESSYIKGRFAVSDNGGGAAAFMPIPVGRNSFRPLFLKNYVCTGSFTIEYFNGNPRTVFGNVMGAGLDHISSMEYWTIDAPAGFPSANIELSFYDPNSGGVTSMPDLRVARFDGIQWVDHGNIATAGTPGTNGSVTSGTVTSYSPFTLASVNANNPLPDRRIQLTGARSGTQARLLWQVNADADITEYILERSRNGSQFAAVSTVASRQSNAAVEYTAAAPLENGRNYYRVAARLQSGRLVYSNMVLLAEAGTGLLLYPNPVTDLLRISSPASGSLYELRNAAGARVRGGRIAGSTATIDMRALPAGMYYLRVVDAAGMQAGQVVIKD